METITIPSPSAFLTKAPVCETHSLPRVQRQSIKNNQRRPLASSGQTPTTAQAQSRGIGKPKQSKSRNGCITCKGKRLKCDETKPTCEQCRKRNVPCGGYSKAFKWRSFEEANFTGKSGPKPRKVSPPPPPSAFRAIPIQAQSRSSPSNESNSEPALITTDDHELQQPPLSPTTFCDPSQISPQLNGGPSPLSPTFPNHAYPPQPHIHNAYQYQAFVDQLGPDAFPSTRPTSIDFSRPIFVPSPRRASPFSSSSPTLQDILLPGTDMKSPPPSVELRPPRSPLPYMPSGYTPPADADSAMEEEEEIEEVVRTNDPATDGDSHSLKLWNNWSFRLPSASPSPSESSSSSTTSAIDLWAQPRLPSNSQEMLVVQFDRQTCGILSVKDGPHENPWRTVMWPLAQDSKPLYHAIASLTAFHSAKASPELRVDGMKHMHKSVSKLASSLNDMKFDGRNDGNGIEAALATTLVLAFSEGWDQHVSTGIKHLKGAKYFVKQAVTKHQNAVQAGRQTSQQLHRLKFLCNSFIYMDVIARLTSLEDDDFGDLDKVLATFNQPFDNMAEIDPLMGAASTLFPFIGRAAAIVTRVRRSDTNSFTLISDAIELKRQIEQWQPPASVSFETPEDPTSEVQHSIQTAEAYRWATLLYLHQAVPEIPSDPAAVLADRVLKYLATVPLSSRAIIIQIFPLLAASCEAITQEDRKWVKNRWTAMSARMSIGNVDKCFEVIKEVWDRRDHFEAEKADRFLRRQAARGLPTNGLFPPMLGRSRKRKASHAEATYGDGFSYGSGASEFETVGPRSFSKRRFTAGQTGLPSSIGADGQGTSIFMPGDPCQTETVQASQPLQSHMGKRSKDIPLESIEPEYTVRGRLHWIGVMRDRKWEVFLG